MITAPDTIVGFELLMRGSMALCDMEQRGMAVDVQYAHDQIPHLKRRQAFIAKQLDSHPDIVRWRETYGGKFNLGSDDQLADMLFNHLGHKSTKKTKSGAAATDYATLEALGLPWLGDRNLWAKLGRARSPFLSNILAEQIDGIIHPFFNLHNVITYRSSSNRPNFQNIPKREKLLKRIVRRAYIPRPGRMIVELDYGKLEVCIATCYHKDPEMILELEDPDKDMHGDMAMECYILTRDELGPVSTGHPGDKVRFCAKNCFVFPEFYGDYFVACAKALWGAIDRDHLTTAQGVPMKEHLRSKGINSLEGFTEHIEAIEADFWDNRFPAYANWKEEWWERYQRQGYIDTLTGFRCSGMMSRNDSINYPVQGSAFHCCLWACIEINRELKARGMDSMLIGQIHDAIVADVVPDELPEFLSLSNEISTQRIREAWPWIIVPLEIEAEGSEVDGNWARMTELELAA